MYLCLRKTMPLLAVTVCLSWGVQRAMANVDLEWRQAPGQVHVGDTVNIGLYAVSDNQNNQLMAGLDVIFAWDPDHLQLVGIVNNGPYAWMSSAFPVGDPFGLNEVVPPQDGDGLYLAQGRWQTLPQATPEGLLVTTFQFEALANTCGTDLLILATGGSPETETVVWSGSLPGTPITGSLGQLTVAVDDVAPVFDSCDDYSVDITPEPGDPCEIAFDPSSLMSVSDDCDPAPTLICMRSDGLDCLADPYPCGVTTVTWTATDLAGNSSECVQTITVNGGFWVHATVELLGVYRPALQRCITFELYTCGLSCPEQPDPLVVDQVMTFSSPGPPTSATGSVTLFVPCGEYACITARDKLHTLRRTISPIPMNGSGYAPVFMNLNTVPPDDPAHDPMLDHSLHSGNLNGDDWIDIVDYGLMASRWNTFVPADTDCSISFPPAHADFSGNGLVWSEDLTFLIVHMWEGSDEACCDAGEFSSRPGPIQRVSVTEFARRQTADVSAADLNHDGWLDAQDVRLWAEQPPVRPPSERPKSRRDAR